MKVKSIAAQILEQEIILNKTICRILGVLFFILGTTFGAYVYIPLPWTPVPITLQTFFVLLSGAVLESRLGLLSQTGYVFLGLLGLPVFAEARSGLLVLSGPTGGYLIGFIFASFLIGKLLEKSMISSSVRIIVSMLLGNVIIYLLGAVGLSIVMGYGVKKTILCGVLPFLPGDVMKLLIASFIYRRIQIRCKTIFG